MPGDMIRRILDKIASDCYTVAIAVFLKFILNYCMPVLN